MQASRREWQNPMLPLQVILKQLGPWTPMMVVIMQINFLIRMSLTALVE
jgi:hypothetical protein